MRRFTSKTPQIQRARTALVNSKMQTENNANFQASNTLISATEEIQAQIEGKLDANALIPVKQISGLPLVGDNVYIPIWTAVANVDAVAGFFTYWTRFNQQIEVWGKVTIDVTASGVLTEASLTLPLPGIFQHAEQASGCANGIPFSGSTNGFPGIVSADPITGLAVVRFYSTNAVDNDVRFIFKYLYIPKQ